MTGQSTIADTHTWDGHTLPTWLHPHQHRWDDGQLLIHHPDGDTRPQPGWLFVGWSDGTVTVASPTTADRVYGPDGIHGRLLRAEAAIERVRAQHTRVDVTDDCYECSQRDYPDYSVPWPCPTIKELNGDT